MVRDDIVVGVDVSLRRGLDVVVLADGSRILEAPSALDSEGLSAVLADWCPAAVAIDSPPFSGREPGASSRACERELRALGVNIFLTPSDAEKFAHRFYDWIRVGADAFRAAAAAGYPLQDEAAVVRGRALEVFPHASDVFLRRCLPPPGTTRRVGSKRAWRLETLRLAGVATDGLRTNRLGEPTLDSIDAALAALTAHHAVDGNFGVLGNPGQWIVVPGTTTGPFVRGLPTA